MCVSCLTSVTSAPGTDWSDESSTRPLMVPLDLAGFKRYERKSLSLSSSERLSAGDLKLELGTVSESVVVSAEITKVQDVSSERSALLDSTQVTNLMSRGRDVMALLTILP